MKTTNEDAENKHVYFNPKNKCASFSGKKLAIGQIFFGLKSENIRKNKFKEVESIMKHLKKQKWNLLEITLANMKKLERENNFNFFICVFSPIYSVGNKSTE